VGVIGTGSVGMHLVSHLARLAPDHIVVVDRGQMKVTGVLTHPIHPRDLGRKKAEVAGELAKAVSPTTRVFAFDRDLADLPTHVLANLDYLFLASDNIGAEVTLTQRALRLGIPIIQASVYGSSLSAVTRIVHGGDDGAGPGLCCGLHASEWDALDRAEVFSCAPDDRAVGDGPLPTTAPTASVSHLCSIAADIGFMEFFRRLAGLGKPAGNRLIEYCGYNHRTVISSLHRRADCPLDHSRDRVRVCEGDLSERTPRELLRAAGYDEGDRASLSVEGRSFAGLAWCRCDTHPSAGRFVANGEALGTCSRCGSERSAHPMHLYSDVPANALAKCLDRPLASLGAPGATAARVRGERGAVQYVEKFPVAEGSK
jgi:molybdopterin/thiamine biosynthesis adenylyltransferase